MRRDLAVGLAARGERADKIWYAYTTCPRCAKVYGHNYVVLFARISPNPLPEAEPYILALPPCPAPARG